MVERPNAQFKHAIVQAATWVDEGVKDVGIELEEDQTLAGADAAESAGACHLDEGEPG